MKYQCDITIYNLPENEEDYEREILELERLLKGAGYDICIGVGEAE